MRLPEISVDLEAARKYFELTSAGCKCCQRGCEHSESSWTAAHAQHNLGSMYRDGIGVAQNYTEAARWYQRAADQGLSTAQ
jgi:TPR repeat protein